MIAVIDKTQLNADKRDLPMRGNLELFIDEVAKTNPLLEFRADKNCVASDWDRSDEDGTNVYNERLYRVKVFQDGEELGSLQATTRYVSGKGREYVYGIESFRISKERGNRNTTYSKDLKVALRTAKKALVSRASSELQYHINYNVAQGLNNLLGQRRNQARYDIDMHNEMMNYVALAYVARSEGKDTVELPAKLQSVRNIEEHHTRCERLAHITALNDMLGCKEGYGLQIQPDGQIVCLAYGDEPTVKKYASLEDLPSSVGEKLSVFKVLDVGEAYMQFGAKLEDNFFFIAK